jgi:hypothetical protein
MIVKSLLYLGLIGGISSGTLRVSTQKATIIFLINILVVEYIYKYS